MKITRRTTKVRFWPVVVQNKGRCMALDTNTFLMVLVAAIFVMGVVIWVMLKKAG